MIKFREIIFRFKFNKCLSSRNVNTSNKFPDQKISSDNSLVKLTHTGPCKMVNVGSKLETFRYAKASCTIKTNKLVIDLIKSNSYHKGDVFTTSEIAGILAAKKTSDLIPLCHQINLNTVKIKIEIISDDRILIESYVESYGRTGVEMEAMVAVSISALTIYDMCKAVDKEIVISETKLIEKFGGKNGHFILKSS